MRKTSKFLLFVSIFTVLMVTSLSGSDSFVISNSPIASLDRPGWDWVEFGTNYVVSTDSSDSSEYMSLAVNHYSGEVYAIWSDMHNSDGEGDWDIYVNTFYSSWGFMGEMSPNSDSHSYYPTLECDSSGNVYFAWDDAVNDDGQGDSRSPCQASHWEDSSCPGGPSTTEAPALNKPSVDIHILQA